MARTQDPMDELRATFFEEAEERGIELEALLLDLERDPDNRDVINRIFRAVHSVKGAAGACELMELARFVHAFESLLDPMRTGRAALTPSVANTLFQASDVLHELVHAAKHGVAPECDIDAAILAIQDALRSALGENASESIIMGAGDGRPNNLVILWDDEPAVVAPSAPAAVRATWLALARSVRPGHSRAPVGGLVGGPAAQSVPQQKDASKATPNAQPFDPNDITAQLLAYKQLEDRPAELEPQTASVHEPEPSEAGGRTDFEAPPEDPPEDLDYETETAPASHNTYAEEAPTVEARGSAREQREEATDTRAVEVSSAKLDGWNGLTGELVTMVARLSHVAAAPLGQLNELKETLVDVHRSASAIQENLSTVRADDSPSMLEGTTVRVGEELYVIPTVSVSEYVEAASLRIYTVPRLGQMTMLRGRAIPVHRLAVLLRGPNLEGRAGEQVAVIVCGEQGPVGLLVDEVIDQNKVLLKVLETNLGKVPGFIGATPVGTGLALVVSIAELLRPHTHAQHVLAAE